MKQKSIFALVLGAILVLTLSSTKTAFADYNEYDDDRDNEYEKEHDRDDDDRNDDDRNDSDDKWQKEKRS
jgi:hypothetical protein